MPERFSASNAARHMACHASANLELAIPNWVRPVEDRTADNAANRGTAKHKMIEPIVQLPPSEMQQMIDLLQYIHDLRKGKRYNMLVEQKMEVAWLSSKPETTADLVLYTQTDIHIIDSKWGKIEVPVHDNAQLLYYAVTYAPFAPKAKGVTVHIAQPAINNFASEFIPAADLKQFMDEAIETDRAISAGDLTFGPSDHCKFCPANPQSRGLKAPPYCPTLMDMYYPKPFNEDEILSL